MERNIVVAYLLWFFFGFLGVHRFYCGKYITGIIWLLTGGLCGIGWLIDIFLVPFMVSADNNK
jgi:TM2 domain-containing membrane protein YozV